MTRRTSAHLAAVAPGAARPARRAWLWPLLAALAVAAYAALHSPMFLVRHLRVTGLVQLSAAQVVHAAAIPDGTYLWQVRPWNVARRIELLPLVRAAQVRLLWPDQVVIAVSERQPVCLVTDGTQVLELDAAARLILREPAAAAPKGLPIVAVSGLSASGLRPGQRLPDATAGRHAVDVAMGLGAQGRALVAAIDVGRHGEVTLQLHDGLSVGFGDGSDARRKTEELLGMLQVIRQRHLHAAYIDLASAATPTLKLQPGH